MSRSPWQVNAETCSDEHLLLFASNEHHRGEIYGFVSVKDTLISSSLTVLC